MISNSNNKYKNNFVLDLRYAETPNTGLSRFGISLFSELVDSFKSDEYEIHILLPPLSECSHLTSLYKIDNSNLIYTHWPFKRGILWKIPFLLFDFKLYKYLFRNNIGLYITPYIDPPFLPGITVASTIHDLSFIEVKSYFQTFSLFKRFVSYVRILLTLLSSNYIFTVSDSTKRALRKNFGYLFPLIGEKLNDILVLSNGVQLPPFKSAKNFDKSRIDLLPDNYLLYVGDRRPHKNIIYLVDLILSISKITNNDLKLVIAGSNKYRNFKLNEKIRKCSDVVYEYLEPSDGELDYLYTHCQALCLLSLSEGFGIPVIEAASRGAKIIISNIPALVEIAPINSLILDLQDQKNHVEKILEYIKNPLYPEPELVLRNWSWKVTALKLKKFIVSHLNKNN